MKLRNKKTGEIFDGDVFSFGDMNSLAKLNEEWEDYQEPKEYWWYIDNLGVVNQATFITVVEQAMAKDSKEIGNYFETREEAEQAVRKLMAWKVLNDLGFKFCGIRYRDGKNYIEWHVEQDTRDDHFKAEAFNEALHLLFGDTQHESN